MAHVPPSPSGGPPASPRLRQRAESLPAAALLVALTAVAPLAVDMFLPSMPAMTEELASSETTLQLAVTLFLLAFAGSQLVYGPLSDRYGRRPALVGGLLLFVAGGLIALFATSAEMLIAGRVVQGLGGGAGPAVANAIVLDVYGRERSARVLALMTIALPLAPAIAPIIGGVLQDVFHWRAVFVTLAVAGVGLLLAYRAMLPETNTRRDPEALHVRGLLRNYRELFSSPQYVAYAAVMALMFSGQLVFISSSSFVLIDERGLSPSFFGLGFGFVALGIMAGASMSSRLVSRQPLPRVVRLGALVAASGGVTMAALAWAEASSVWAVLLPMFVTAIGFGLSRPSAMAGALIPFPHIAGLASAFVGFSTIAFASAYNIAFGQLVDVSTRSMATGVAIAACSGLLAVLVLRPGGREAAPRPERAQASAPSE